MPAGVARLERRHAFNLYDVTLVAIAKHTHTLFDKVHRHAEQD